jgi:acetylornithine/succinyldiaminopimelate/putrescine aminotransferase
MKDARKLGRNRFSTGTTSKMNIIYVNEDFHGKSEYFNNSDLC